MHLIILGWAVDVSLSSKVPTGVLDRPAPPLKVRIVEPPESPIIPSYKAEPPTPPSKIVPVRKNIVARPRPKPLPSVAQEAREPSRTVVEPLAGTVDAYETSDRVSASENLSRDGVEPKVAASAANAPLSSAGQVDIARQQGSVGAKEVLASANPANSEPTVDLEQRGSMTGESAFQYQIAPFPRPITLSFAVHAPKDYRESSGSSGTAELRTELISTPNGLDQFAIKVEINLSWLLKRMVGGSLNYESRGQIGAQGPHVGRYSEKIGERPPRWLEVDAQKNLMKSFSIASLGVPPTTQDRLSIIWLLGMMARADPGQLEKGKVFSIPMFTFRQTYPGRFESMGNEVLESPAGILQSLHVAYTTQVLGGDKVDIWLGYDFEMQPVRIRWEEAQGRVIDLILLKKPQ